jgi:hypothetical protein
MAITESLVTFWSTLKRGVRALSEEHRLEPEALSAVINRLRELCIERPERFTAPSSHLGIRVDDVIEAARAAESHQPWREMIETKLNQYRPEPQPAALDSLTARLLGEPPLRPTADSLVTRIGEMEFFGEELRPRAQALTGRRVTAPTWDAFLSALVEYAHANGVPATQRLEREVPEADTLLSKVHEIAAGALTNGSDPFLDYVFTLWWEAARDKRTETPNAKAAVDLSLPVTEAPGEERSSRSSGSVLRKWRVMAMKDTLASDPVLQEHGMEVLLDPRSSAWQSTGAAEKQWALVAAMRPWFDWQNATRRPQAEVALKGFHTREDLQGAAPAHLLAAALQLQSAYDPSYDLPSEPEEVEAAFRTFAAAQNGRLPESLHAWEVPVTPEPLGREILDVRSSKALSPLDRSHALEQLAEAGVDLVSAVAEYYHHYRGIKELSYVVRDLVFGLFDLVYLGLVSRVQESTDKDGLQGNGVIGECLRTESSEQDGGRGTGWRSAR